MIYIVAPFILLFDTTTLYFGTKLISRVQISATSSVSGLKIVRQSLQLLLLRALSPFVNVDGEKLKLYKINKPLITRVALAVFLNVAWLIGLVWVAAEIYSNLGEYQRGAQDGLIFVTTVLSALATLFTFLLYILTKESTTRHKLKFWLNFDNIGSDDHFHFGAPAGALIGGADAPLKGTRMKKATEEDAIYWSLEFVDDRKAARALHIYRTDRHGQYQYLGLPEPKTIVVHKQDVTGLIERLRDEGYLPDSDFALRPVFLAGQLSPEERVPLRRRGLNPSSKLHDPQELERRLQDARKRLAMIREK